MKVRGLLDANAGAPSLRARRHRGGQNSAYPICLIFPSLLLLGGVAAYPLLYAIQLSLYETQFIQRVRFVGLAHYVRLFQEPEIANNVFSSFAFVAGSLLVVVPLAFALALALNEPLPGSIVFRIIILLPWVISQFAAALLWKWLLNGLYGPVTYAVQLLGLPPLNVFGTPLSAMITLILVNTWRTYPFAMLLLLARLQTAPAELYEAARVDGAAGWSLFLHVTFPWTRSTLLITMILVTIGTINIVALPFVLTEGGPMGGTEVLVLRLWREAFQFHDHGMGATLSVVIMAFNFLCGLAYIWLLREDEETLK